MVSQSIGYGLVQLLAEKGHRVYLAARNPTRGLEAQAKLKADGLEVQYVQLDVTSPESVAAAAAVVEKAEGHLDTLINNAGVGLMHNSTGAATEPLANVQAAMDINFYGLLTVSQAFIPLLKRAPEGQACIVNVSIPTKEVLTNPKAPKAFLQFVSYLTSKSAANSYTPLLAKELEGVVKVNAVSPGFVTTNLNGNKPGGKTWRQGAEVIAPWALLGPEDKDKTGE